MDSQESRMYGLPKIHKPNVPLRPILYMCGLMQYELAKWLVPIRINDTSASPLC